MSIHQEFLRAAKHFAYRPSHPENWRQKIFDCLKFWNLIVVDCTAYVSIDTQLLYNELHATDDIIGWIQLTGSVDDRLKRDGTIDFRPFGEPREVTPEEFACYHQILVYFKKLRLDRSDLVDSLTQSFIHHDERLPSSFNEGLIARMRRHIESWLKDIDFSVVPFDHGSGAVAQRGVRTQAQKDENLSLHRKAELALKLLEIPIPPIAKTHEEIPSRLTFVPKSATTLRSICMEPVINQFLQQGFMKVLYRHIAHHPYLSKHIKLRDQTYNNHLARIGSACGAFATVDLSRASDSVSNALVKLLFKRTRLYIALIGTRSRYADTPLGRHLLQMFAPMGSALCFPIECLVFAAATKAAVDYGRERQYIPDIWGVYGDDIVLPTQCFETLVVILTHLGFTVNTEKSFVEGGFRESCGREYYNGYDVTPMYYRVLPQKMSPQDLSRWISHANLAYERGYTGLRKECVSTIFRRTPSYTRRKQVVQPVLFSSYPDEGLWTDAPDNASATFRHRGYQCAAQLILRAGPNKYVRASKHIVRIYCWLANKDFAGDELVTDSFPFRDYVGSKWIVGTSFWC